VNPQIRKLGGVLLACYLALFVQLNLTQVARAPQLNERPDNTRAIERDVNRPRGDVVSADGQLLAHSVETDGRFRYQRNYPTGDLFAHVVGSYSFLFGADGVERRYNDALAGQTPSLRFGGFTDPFAGEPNVGNVHLTIDSRVQRVAADALGQREGSVVAIDPRDGSILALWSFPTYDPNLPSSNDSVVARAFRQALAELTPRERSLLRLNLVDGISIDALAPMYAVSRATVARWLASARHALQSRTVAAPSRHTQLAGADLDGLMASLDSGFDLSLRRFVAEASPES